jgi:hypothetical protein
VDRCVVKTDRKKLGASDVPLLRYRGLGDLFRFSKVISHTPMSQGSA